MLLVVSCRAKFLTGGLWKGAPTSGAHSACHCTDGSGIRNCWVLAREDPWLNDSLKDVPFSSARWKRTLTCLYYKVQARHLKYVKSWMALWRVWSVNLCHLLFADLTSMSWWIFWGRGLFRSDKCGIASKDQTSVCQCCYGSNYEVFSSFIVVLVLVVVLLVEVALEVAAVAVAIAIAAVIVLVVLTYIEYVRYWWYLCCLDILWSFQDLWHLIRPGATW